MLEIIFYLRSGSSLSVAWVLILNAFISSKMINIIDIRDECLNQNLRCVLEESLLSQQPSIPPLLLWDELGMELFAKITENGSINSYGSSAEIEILSSHFADISKVIGDDGILVDLGAGWAIISTSRNRTDTFL